MGDLLIEDSGAKITLQQNNLVAKNSNREIIYNTAISRIDNILIFGNPQITTQCLKALAQQQVGVHYFDHNGKYLTSLESFNQDNYEKQRQQFIATLNEEFRLAISKRIIVNKIFLQRELLWAYDEDRLLNDTDYHNLQARIRGVHEATTLQEVMGQEGRAAKTYFHYLGLLIHPDFRFRGRTSRPALDATNAMLNLGYGMLYANMRGMIKKYGLHLGLAFLHQNKGRHATLVSDLMEVWRPVIVDDTVMTLCKNQQIQPQHFDKQQNGSVNITPKGRKILYTEMKQKLKEKHHYLAGNNKLLTATYSLDLQIASLQRAVESLDAREYILLGMNDDEMV